MQKIACKFWNSAAWAEAGGICFGITWLWLEKFALFFFAFFFFFKKGNGHWNKSLTCHKKQKSDPVSNLILERAALTWAFPPLAGLTKRILHLKFTTVSNTSNKLLHSATLDKNWRDESLTEDKRCNIWTFCSVRKVQYWQLSGKAQGLGQPMLLSSRALSAVLVHIRARVGWRLRKHFWMGKVKKLHVRARLWRACFLLTGCTSWILCNFYAPCRDIILMGGSHWDGQQKLGLLCKDGRGRGGRQANPIGSDTTHSNSQGEILQWNIAPFQPPVTQRPRELAASAFHSPWAGEMGQACRHRELWQLHLGLGASLDVSKEIIHV